VNSLSKTNPNSSSKGSSVEREQYLYLTTRGRKSGLPREIEIWFTRHNEHFFVIAEYPASQWVQNLRVNPEAQVRVADEKFSARVRFVSPENEPALHHAVADLSRSKYGWGDGSVVELIPESNSRR